MKIVFCGTLVPAKYENRITQLSNAANRFIMNLVRELTKKTEVEVYSYLGIAVNNAIIRELKDTEHYNAQYYIRYFPRTADKIVGTLKYRKAIRTALKSSDWIITYNAIYAWLFAPDMARRMGKKSMLILADYSPPSTYSQVYRRIYAKAQMRTMRKYDLVVGLSDKSAEYLASGQRFICVEGGIAQEVFDRFEREEQRQKGPIRIMYAGILEPVTGVDILLDAFGKICRMDIELHISGKGSLEKDVLEAAGNDPRIRFLGCVPYEDYLKNLSNADILINPRNMNLPENKYNFPSKIMEYMATGKPIISTRFPGWEKFEPHISFCDSTASSIKEMIEYIIRQPITGVKERNREKACEFIWKNQADRILAACRSVEREKG